MVRESKVKNKTKPTALVGVYSQGYYTFVTLERYDKKMACMFVDNCVEHQTSDKIK